VASPSFIVLKRKKDICRLAAMMTMALLLTPMMALSGFVAANQVGGQTVLGPMNLGGLAQKPNIVFILTDDQDLHMNSLDYTPLINQHLTKRGTLYKRHFCTTAVCCPSRVSLWTGKQAHNTNVTDVNPPHGNAPDTLQFYLGWKLHLGS